ncbi:cation transporter [Acidiphilium iwatense]|uniref:Cation transporter n=1 Tax=Acidiphilium iwatense TaxID=768198 RepID=A0ABS9DUH0_9PROT|nr:cation transporter [Acidiphilium iwatense]MCF3946378.1 cation transporter [Acidiphilium iwatense]
MTGCCPGETGPDADAAFRPGWRLVLWTALALNVAMFAIEIGAGLAAGSASLRADALDFLGDAANYGISLGVAGMALSWRARAALVKGITMFGFGLWVLASTAWLATTGNIPHAGIMSGIAILALATNAGVAVMLSRFRGGDANMRSVWICSRNDALGNLAVLLAAFGVFATSTFWPDFVVALVMGTLAIVGGGQVIRQAIGELRHHRTPRELVSRA